MRFGGDGIISTPVLFPLGQQMDIGLPFMPRRFEAGGRLEISNSHLVEGAILPTCVLCGGLITDDDSTLEHPLPQWLHRFAGEVSEKKASGFSFGTGEPTWRQLSLASHRSCNATFGQKIEEPAVGPIKAMLAGGKLTGMDIDKIFDWLDKVKAASAHMGVALRGHNISMGYDEVSFPNKRVGIFDRIAIIFKTDESKRGLDLWDCLNDGFLTTPSAICIQINNYIIVFVSGNYLLSDAFGLGKQIRVKEFFGNIIGSNRFSAGFGSRKTRLPTAKILAQPMPRWHRKNIGEEHSHALFENGDGKVFELNAARWNRVRSTNFENIPVLRHRVGRILSSIECIEWIIQGKHNDDARYLPGERFFMKSLPQLEETKSTLLSAYSQETGLPIAISDN